MTAVITTFSNCFYNSGKKAKWNWKQTNKKDTVWYQVSNRLGTSSLGSYRPLDDTTTHLWMSAAWESSSNTQLVLVKILSLVLSGWSPVQWWELSSAAYKTPPNSFYPALGWKGLAQKPVRCPVSWEQSVPQGRKATANCTLQATWCQDEPAHVLPRSYETDVGPFPESGAGRSSVFTWHYAPAACVERRLQGTAVSHDAQVQLPPERKAHEEQKGIKF